MYAQNKLSIHSWTLAICIFCSMISLPYNTWFSQEKKVKTETGSMATGVVQTVSVDREVNLNEKPSWKDTIQLKDDTQRCNKDCKIWTLTGIGMDVALAKPLVENCKRLADNPVHCIISWASIIMAESGGKITNCRKYNCMGLGGGSFWYTSYEVQIIDWISRYNKYWYKAKSASFFYPTRWEVSKSRYCTSEHSSWSSVGCPNWLSHASKTWNTLSKKF